ncbi:MAG: hypothetical protein RDV48_09340 [Candidatus Eremiobacteraeota bacterium]|nr:hypothetical protein [Candidatus Eremiobacteraeota bacterium]
MKKNISSYFLVLVMLLVIAGCGGIVLYADINGGSAWGPTPYPSPAPSMTPVETVLATGRTNAFDIALSPDGQYAYWTENIGNGGGVYRIKTSGDPQNKVETVAGGYPSTYSLTLGASGGTSYLYFTQKSSVGTVMRLKVPEQNEGWGTAETYVKGLTNPVWIKFNTDGCIYWTEFVQANGRMRRINAGIPSSQVPQGGFSTGDSQVETINSTQGFNFPYNFCFDGNGNALVAELAGSGSTIWFVKLAKDQAPFKAYTNSQNCRYPTALLYDNSTNFVYFANYQQDTGIYRFLFSTAAMVTTADTLETGRWRPFALSGPHIGQLFFSVNETRANAGSIYYESVNDITLPAVNALGPWTTCTSPLTFQYSGGLLYWVEDPEFNVVTAECVGSTQCRVMKFNPSGTQKE